MAEIQSQVPDDLVDNKGAEQGSRKPDKIADHSLIVIVILQQPDHIEHGQYAGAADIRLIQSQRQHQTGHRRQTVLPILPARQPGRQNAQHICHRKGRRGIAKGQRGTYRCGYQGSHHHQITLQRVLQVKPPGSDTAPQNIHDQGKNRGKRFRADIHLRQSDQRPEPSSNLDHPLIVPIIRAAPHTVDGVRQFMGNQQQIGDDACDQIKKNKSTESSCFKLIGMSHIFSSSCLIPVNGSGDQDSLTTMVFPTPRIDPSSGYTGMVFTSSRFSISFHTVSSQLKVSCTPASRR